MTELIEWMHKGRQHIGTHDDLAGELLYHMYRNNRRMHPTRTPEEWGAIFMDWEQFEERYKNEKTTPYVPE